MMSILIDFARLLAWALLLLLIFVPVERLFALRAVPIWRPGRLVDTAYYFLNGLFIKWLMLLPVAAIAAVAHALIPGQFHAAVAELPFGARLAAVVVIGDVGAYWGHRWAHASGWIWRFHAVHHSARDIDWMVNTRAHPVDLVFVRVCGLFPLYALGLVQAQAGQLDSITAAYMVLGTAWGFFVHANVRWRLGWLEQVIATPAFHHWHHANDAPEVRDKNFAAIFPWIDRLFGTLHLPHDRWPSSYGIDSAVGATLLQQLAQPLRASREPSSDTAHGR